MLKTLIPTSWITQDPPSLSSDNKLLEEEAIFKTKAGWLFSLSVVIRVQHYLSHYLSKQNILLLNPAASWKWFISVNCPQSKRSTGSLTALKFYNRAHSSPS